MKHAALFAMLLAVGGCAFAQKHPGVTVGIVAGTMGFGLCEIATEKAAECAAVGGIAGAGLGLITGLVTMFADTSAHELTEDEGTDVIVAPPNDEPPGLPIDAGVVAPVAADAGVPLADASASD